MVDLIYNEYEMVVTLNGNYKRRDTFKKKICRYHKFYKMKPIIAMFYSDDFVFENPSSDFFKSYPFYLDILRIDCGRENVRFELFYRPKL